MGIGVNVRVPGVDCWVGGSGSGSVRPRVMPWHRGHLSADAKALLMSHGRSSRRSALIYDT